ncbi:Vegetative incompatibility protein [Paramyrothecium foliicola]|nr:Vegetative incompatibility protein [Paramyrothecium foliicola]
MVRSRNFYELPTMRLINIESLVVIEFRCDSTIPPYVVVSHAWQNDEIFFGDLMDRDAASKKAGFEKLQNACQIVRGLGMQWLWVDSICIDRSSSAELSEALNSMFQLYAKANVCLVYLHDLAPSSDMSNRAAGLRNCIWIRRPWSLQEVIAPKQVHFYDSVWTFVGTKASLATYLNELMGIDRDVLVNKMDFARFSIAKRMSWASRCLASRIEDVAYSLLGILGVHLAIIYGEGQRAFIRLQEEILKTTDDASLFAWQATDRQHHRGIFATSPAEFSHLIDAPDMPPLRVRGDVFITSGGVNINSLFVKSDTGTGLVLILFQKAFSKSEDNAIGIPLHGWNGHFVRSYPWLTLSVDKLALRSGVPAKICVHRDVNVSAFESLQMSHQFEHLKNKKGSDLFDDSGFLDPPLLFNRNDVDPGLPAQTFIAAIPYSTCELTSSAELDASTQALPSDGGNSSATMMQTKFTTINSVCCAGSETVTSSASTNKEIGLPTHEQNPWQEDLSTSSSDSETENWEDEENQEEEEEDDMYLFTEPLMESPHLSCNHPFTQFKGEISKLGLQKFKLDAAGCEIPTSPGKRRVDNTGFSQNKRSRSTYDLQSRSASTGNYETDSTDVIGHTKEELKQKFACPYFKRDPQQFRTCLTRCDLKTIADVKQHLWFAHRLPNFCPVCKQTFETTAAWRLHMMDRSCTKQSLPNFVGITQSQMHKLARRACKSTPEQEQWFEVWNIVFPGEPKPENGFLSGRVESWVCSVRDYWADMGQYIIAQFLLEKGMQNYDLIPNEERELAGLYDAILNHMIDQIVDGHSLADTIPTGGGRAVSEIATNSLTPIPYHYEGFDKLQADVVSAFGHGIEDEDEKLRKTDMLQYFIVDKIIRPALQEQNVLDLDELASFIFHDAARIFLILVATGKGIGFLQDFREAGIKDTSLPIDIYRDERDGKVYGSLFEGYTMRRVLLFNKWSEKEWDSFLHYQRLVITLVPVPKGNWRVDIHSEEAAGLPISPSDSSHEPVSKDFFSGVQGTNKETL